MHKKKLITIIGPFGEVGGVSIHIKRLTELLDNHFDFIIINESRIKKLNDSKIINLRSYSINKYLRAIFNAEIVHIHSGKNLLRIFHLCISFILNSPSIITLHSYRNPSFAIRFILRHLPFRTIAVSQEIQEKLQGNTCVVLNAFIPPISEKKEILDGKILDKVNELKSHGRFIITGNAFRLVEYQGKDLYGVDQLIELAEMLKHEKIKVSIIFFIGSLVNCENKYHEFQGLIKAKDVGKYILLINKQVPFINIIQECDLIVRPTLSDGDALTIREALHYHKPVIASDVVKRPEGTILYKTANVKDLLSKIKRVISNGIQSKKIDTTNQDYKNVYLKIYETSNSKL